MEHFCVCGVGMLSWCVMHYYIEVPFGASASTVLSSLQLHVENMWVPGA